MTDAQAEQLDGINQVSLTPLVQRALGRPTVQVIDWDVQKIHGGTGGGVVANAVFRFTGLGRDREQTVPWSLILKTFPTEDDTDPSAPYYQHREADAYRSGWLDELPGSLVAPACYGVVEHPGEGVWVWLEELVDNIGSKWPLERYGLAARHLGEFNGAFLMAQSLPTWSWFSVGWLRRTVAESAYAISQFPGVLTHPLVRRYYPGDAGDRCLRLWAERERLLDALDQLPRTICHMDAFPRNLFSRRVASNDQTVAIDWTFVGLSAVGEDLEPLVCRSLAFNDVELTQQQELDEIVFSGYLDGLFDAGWQGDPRQVRLGYTAAVTLRYLMGVGVILPYILDGSIRQVMPQLLGLTFDETVDISVACQRFQFGLAEEALELLDILL